MSALPSPAPTVPVPAGSLDAELIRACHAYSGLMAAVNSNADGNEEDGPAWQSYADCADTITEATPRTMAGVLAKARAIKTGVLKFDGVEQLHGTVAEYWALDVVNALLRLNGGAA